MSPLPPRPHPLNDLNAAATGDAGRARDGKGDVPVGVRQGEPARAAAVAGGTQGHVILRQLTGVALDALAQGAVQRGGPLPAGGPTAVADAVRAACSPVLPELGTGAEEALRTVVRAVARGAADPADPYCVGHLHCPPLAVAAAADLAASALNPSMDSWDQAPAAGAVEEQVTAALARLVYPARPTPDALITSGGTESNLVALLLARERARADGMRTVQVVCGANAHHSVARAAWMLGLSTPAVAECRDGRILPAALDRVLAEYYGTPLLVVATAGTTDEGLIDPLPEIAQIAQWHGAELHVDAAYGGPLLFSERLAPRLAGIEQAVSVTFDLHKLGWQPVAAGVLAVADTRDVQHLAHTTDYLNADDDTEAGLPDLLGRSIRTSRRPDAVKMAVTLRALGRDGLGALVEHCVDEAERFAAAVEAHPDVRLRAGEPGISTVLFRPAVADALSGEAGDAVVAGVRRRLLAEGRAVLGRAVAVDGSGAPRLWLKATLLHPQTRADDLEGLLELVGDAAAVEVGVAVGLAATEEVAVAVGLVATQAGSVAAVESAVVVGDRLGGIAKDEYGSVGGRSDRSDRSDRLGRPDRHGTQRGRPGEPSGGVSAADELVLGRRPGDGLVSDWRPADQLVPDQRPADQLVPDQQLTDRQARGRQLADRQATGQQATAAQTRDRQARAQQATAQQARSPQTTEQQPTDEQPTDQPRAWRQQLTEPPPANLRLSDSYRTGAAW